MNYVNPYNLICKEERNFFKINSKWCDFKKAGKYTSHPNKTYIPCRNNILKQDYALAYECH